LEGTRWRMERVPNHLSRTRWLRRLRGAVDCSPPLKQGGRGFQLSKKKEEEVFTGASTGTGQCCMSSLARSQWRQQNRRF
jgi:hypothetical protein